MMAEKSAEPPASGTSTALEDRSTGNWWDSWITSAKTKSAEVYSMVKKDLDEIGTAVKSEASHVFTSTSTAIGKTFKLDEPESPANVMKKSLSTFIGRTGTFTRQESTSASQEKTTAEKKRRKKLSSQVSTVLNPEPDDEDDTEVILSSGDTTMLSTYKKELEALQRVDATYLVPANSAEFDAWRASLEPGAPLAPAAADRRLAASPTLLAMYRKLVPDAVSHEDFWERYLFRVALLQDKLAAASRKQPGDTTDPVMAHLPLQCQPPPIQQSPKKVLSGVEDEELEEPELEAAVWEDEEFANDVELTEEQQTLLLEEYEKEISNKKHKQTTPRDIANNNTKSQKTNTPTQKTKSAQTRDKMNNKKHGRSPKKAGKSDVCGNNLVEDYFGEKEPVKDDASAHSDESWEKEFEIEDVDKV